MDVPPKGISLIKTKLEPKELDYPLNSATKSKLNHRLVTLFSTQPTVQYGQKGAELTISYRRFQSQ